MIPIDVTHDQKGRSLRCVYCHDLVEQPLLCLTQIYHQNSGCKTQLQRIKDLRLVCAAQRIEDTSALLIFVLSPVFTTLAPFAHYFGDTSGLACGASLHAECEKILSTCPILGCAGEEFGVRLDSAPAATEPISQVKIETDSPHGESYTTKANSVVFKTNVNRGYLTRLIASQQPEIDELLNSQEFVYIHSGGGVPLSVESPMKISVESIDELETEDAVLSLEQFPHNSLIYMVCLPFCFICGTVINGFLALFFLVRLINDNKLPSLSFWWLAMAVYLAVTAICLSIRKTIAKKQFKKRAESVVRSLQDILNGNSAVQ